jgi:cytochrome c oxidase assembly protein subunit 15
MGDAAPPLPGVLLREAPSPARSLARGFAALVALTSGLIVLGALVRAHGAGLACPDWPLCFGALVPRMNLEVGFEWTHRLVAGSVALLFAALAVRTLREPALRARAAPLLAVSAGLLALQVLLGALTVWKLLAAWSVTSHLVVGNAFNACLLLLALRLRDARPGARPPAAPARLRALLAASAALLAVQIVLGGLVSSTFAGMACPEWPRCNGGLWFPSWRGSVGLHLAHRWNAYLLAAALAASAGAARGAPRVGRLAALALALAFAQTAVGVANVRLGLPVEVTGLHSALAALLVLTLVASLHESFRKGSVIEP